MNTTDDKLNELITFLEKEIADLEKEHTEKSFQIKLKKAKLKQLKKVNEQPPTNEQ